MSSSRWSELMSNHTDTWNVLMILGSLLLRRSRDYMCIRIKVPDLIVQQC
jgi:hypothetical protein